MIRRNLNLNALRAFEAAARHLNFSRAAEELLVTHAAVSHQIRQLEEQLGVRLFERTSRGVELTHSGAALLPETTASFDRLATTLDSLSLKPSTKTLSITTTPSFASRWLVPRLPSWRKASGDSIDVTLIPTLQMLDLTKGEADVAIRCGIPPWPDLSQHLLLPIHMTPVCSPGLLKGTEPPKHPADLLDHTLLHADVGPHPLGTEWQSWFNAADLRVQRRLPGLSFQDPALSMQAAINGVGFAMGYVELVSADLAFGRLAQPFELVVQHDFSYYVAYSTKRANDPTVVAFREWVLAEATLDLHIIESGSVA